MGKINKFLSDTAVADTYGRPSEDELVKINAISKSQLTADDVFTFNIRLADTVEDRVHDQMTENFLIEFAELAVQKSLTGLKDHDWSVDNQWARVYDAEVVDDESGEKFIKAKAFTLQTNADIIEKIKTGIISEVSTSFESEQHCSICGEPMKKGYDDIGRCPNGHIAGQEYDGVKCKCMLDKCIDAFEFSIVSVPCQPNARIIKGLNGVPVAVKDTNKTGGKAMTKKNYAAKRLLSILKKSQDQPDEEMNELLNTISEAGDEEMSLEDVDKLLQEIEALRARIAELEAEVKACKEKAEADAKAAEDAAVDTVVETEIEKLMPQTEQVKKCMIRDIDRTALKFEDGKLTGLEEQLETVKKNYEGLFGKKEGTDSKDQSTSKDIPKVSFGKSNGTGTRKSFNDACASMK